MSSLRKNFLDGSLPRLPDPDEILRRVLPEYVLDGEFGLAFGVGADGGYGRVCFEERVSPEDIDFAGDVFLLTKKRAQALKAGLLDSEKSAESVLPKSTGAPKNSGSGDAENVGVGLVADSGTEGDVKGGESGVVIFRVSGEIPSEVWNRVGTKLVSKFRDSRVKSLRVGVDFQVEVEGSVARDMREEWSRALADLKLSDKVRIQREDED